MRNFENRGKIKVNLALAICETVIKMGIPKYIVVEAILTGMLDVNKRVESVYQLLDLCCELIDKHKQDEDRMRDRKRGVLIENSQPIEPQELHDSHEIEQEQHESIGSQSFDNENQEEENYKEDNINHFLLNEEIENREDIRNENLQTDYQDLIKNMKIENEHLKFLLQNERMKLIKLKEIYERIKIEIDTLKIIIERYRQSDAEKPTCSVCLDKTLNMLFETCGHLCCCDTCGITL